MPLCVCVPLPSSVVNRDASSQLFALSTPNYLVVHQSVGFISIKCLLDPFSYKTSWEQSLMQKKPGKWKQHSNMLIVLFSLRDCHFLSQTHISFLSAMFDGQKQLEQNGSNRLCICMCVCVSGFFCLQLSNCSVYETLESHHQIEKKLQIFSGNDLGWPVNKDYKLYQQMSDM